MFATLEAKLLGTGILVVCLLGAFGIYTYHERAAGKAIELAALQKSSAKLLGEANATIATLTAAHTKFVADSQEAFDAQQKANLALSVDDANRVRVLDAYRRAHPDVPSTGGGTSAANGGNSNASGVDSSIERLEQVALGLNSADLAAQNSLLTCMKERDSLVGK